MAYFLGSCKVKILNRNSSLLDEVNISDVKKGDTVASWDDLSEEWTYSKVKKNYSDKKLSDFIELNESVGYNKIGYFSFNNLSIKFTPTVSFLTLMGWRAITPLSTIKPYSTGTPEEIFQTNDVILKDNNRWTTVNDITFISCKDEPVYSLSTESNSSYIVENWVVHSK